MINKISFKKELIAPCGMNCGICMAFLRDKNKCPGCRVIDNFQPITRVRCIIKNCEQLRKSNSKYCFNCRTYPCKRLKQLDKRYRTKYSMSMIENLNNIRKNGIRDFLQKEKIRWTCSKCSGVIIVHRGTCSRCGYKKNQSAN